jgi:hypothetical protein
MGWEATGGSWTGGQPGRDHGLPRPPGRSAGFDHGGPWETAVPSAGLAFALERAAGPEGVYPDADTDALVGIARQWAIAPGAHCLIFARAKARFIVRRGLAAVVLRPGVRVAADSGGSRSFP